MAEGFSLCSLAANTHRCELQRRGECGGGREAVVGWVAAYLCVRLCCGRLVVQFWAEGLGWFMVVAE